MPTGLCQWCLSSLSASISTVSQLCSLWLAQDSFSVTLLVEQSQFFLGPWICAFVSGLRFLPQAVPLPAFPQNRILLTWHSGAEPVSHLPSGWGMSKKSELNSPKLLGFCNSVVNPEAGMSYRSLLSFSPCTFLSVLLESNVSLRFCLLSFQSHSKHSLKEQLSLYPDKLVQICPERPLHCLCQGLMTGDC